MRGSEDFYMKTKVSVYDCDTMIVSGTSYYLWVMDYYKVPPTLAITISAQEFSAQVQKIWDEKNCATKQQQQQREGEEEMEMDTPTTSTDCCGRDCAKVLVFLKKRKS